MERIPLTNETFEGNNNAYLFADGPETVLVDTGDRLPGTHEQLVEKFEARGLSLSDVDRIFLTHWHGDHRGLAGPIQQAGDADVYVHEADADLVSGETEAWEALTERQREYFDHWGMPVAKQEELEAVLRSVAWQENAPEVIPIEGGEEFEVNDNVLRAVHTPGHTAGHCTFERTEPDEPSERTELFSGDALLPKYTPNVGGADIRVDGPLDQYLRTLRGIAEADYDRAWPGHRDVIEEPAARAAFIIEHHEERSYRVLDALGRLGPCDTWTVSDDLFGHLEHIHILHGPGESYAHLEHLEREGSVVSEGTEYRLAEGVAERLTDRDDGRWPLESA